MRNVLDKLLVTRYYKLNAGFFLVILIALFGIMSGRETIDFHHAVMTAVTSSFLPLCVACLVCAAYNFKCISFCVRELNDPANSFLFNLQTVSNRQQLFLLFRNQAAVYFPVLIYFGIAVAVGFEGGHYVFATGLLVWQVVMCGTGAAVCFYILNSTWKRPIISLPSVVLFRSKSFPFYLLLYSLHNRKGTFIFVKVCSLVLLQFLVSLNSEKVSRENICFIIMFVIAAHALLPLYYVRYMETELAFLRNMPISLARRAAVFVCTYAIIFLPELLFLLWNERSVLPLQVTLSLYVVAVVRMCLYTALQYVKGMGTDRYTSVVLGLFFASLLLLASVDLWVFAVFESVAAIAIFYRCYPGYERMIRDSE